jgi:hypothetical protein
MSKFRIAAIIALALGLIVLIIWSIKMLNKDVVTGVSNSKIKEAAEAIGLPKEVAKEIANAPDSGAAARRIGLSPVLSVAIANGIPMNTAYYPNANGKCNGTDVLVDFAGAGQAKDLRCVTAKKATTAA